MPTERLALWRDQTDGPSLTLYPAEAKRPRGAVMVCPGGGYAHLADHEGPTIAERLNTAGFDAAVLRYRLGPEHRHPAMIHDAQRGLRLMRTHRSIRAGKIAVLGFSAGGHLASTLAVHHDTFTSDHDGSASSVSARPDAAVLCYPVIDVAGPENAHTGSRNNLLGPDADAALLEQMSTHRHVDARTPPTFLWHTADDPSVPMGNSLLFARACRAAGVPVELHVYESGRHGLGLAEGEPDVAGWWALCLAFLDRHLNDEPAEIA